MAENSIWSTPPAPNVDPKTFTSVAFRVDAIEVISREENVVAGVMSCGEKFSLRLPDPTAAEAQFRDILNSMAAKSRLSPDGVLRLR